MKGIIYTLELLVATTIMVSLILTYSEVPHYSSSLIYSKKAFYTDYFMNSFISSLERSGILEESLDDNKKDLLEDELDKLDNTSFGRNLCIEVERYNLNSFAHRKDGKKFKKKDCKELENFRVYYRLVTEFDQASVNSHVYFFKVGFKEGFNDEENSNGRGRGEGGD